MRLKPEQRARVMCLTQDDLPISHLEQAVRLCMGGARWIQVRMKNAPTREMLHTATMIAAVCRRYEAVCIVNDEVDFAIAARAHGVHLGKTDGSWREARKRLCRGMILGGTVNNLADADRATRAGCLDYVGIGPWRATTTKKNAAPVLGPAGVAELVAALDGLPAWAIGGITAEDVPEVRAIGAEGVAVCSALYRENRISDNFRAFSEAWEKAVNL